MPSAFKYLMWDFDGTLAHRPGQWTDTVLSVLRQAGLAAGVDREVVRPFMNTGFPWHKPEVIRSANQAADDWWQGLEPVFARAFLEVGRVSKEQALTLARQVRPTYLDPAVWFVFDDVVPTLRRLKDLEWRHVVLSNHVPELPQLVADLGLTTYFEAVYSSAATGVEKPNPEAFRRARATLPADARVWMVGDSVDADMGAEAAGISAILVRSNSGHSRCCSNLAGVIEILESDDPEPV